MKTPEDCLKEHCDWLDVDVIYVKSIENAMKEYAKQWVDKCYEDFGTTHDWAVTKDEIKKEIDAQ